MKKIISIMLTFALLFCGSVAFAADKPSDMIKLAVVDKDGVPIANAIVLVISDNGKWAQVSKKSDRDGVVRLYDNRAKMKTVRKNAKYVVMVVQRVVVTDPISESFDCYFDSLKAGSTHTVKLKNKTTKDEIYNAPNRTDFYVTNSKGGAVSNMKINLTMQTPQVPQTNGDSEAYYPLITGYTDKDGRFTITDMAPDKYAVKFEWQGGSCDMGMITIDEKVDVKTFQLKFDETLLKK